MVKLGETVTDSITGFSGVATARSEYLYGCVRVYVEPPGLKDELPIEGKWFDEQRLGDSAAEVGGPGLPVDPGRTPIDLARAS